MKAQIETITHMVTHLSTLTLSKVRKPSVRDKATLALGNVVLIRYKDHVLFKDSDASQYQPWIRETVGWLDYEDEEYVRIVWERFHEPHPPDNARLRSTGLAISKKDIVEMRFPF